MLGLYAMYTLVRNLLGDDARAAERNARRIVDLERALGIFHERGIQRALDHEGTMQLLNTFYGLAHPVVTAGVLMWLLRRRPAYPRWRTALASTTCLALVGYAAFPLMPPRLLPELGIVDSLVVHGGPWNYEDGAISELSNQFAAMPSLHVAWALWCTVALWVEGARTPRGRVPFRVAAVAYSAVAIVAVVATGNHYLLDAVGGAVVLAIGFAIEFAITFAIRFRREVLAGRRLGRSEAVVPAVDGDHVRGVVRAGSTREVHGDPSEVLR